MTAPDSVPLFVVDDDPDTLALLRHDLGSGGISPQMFGSAPDALAALRDRSAALVLADWNMPGMDGLELCGAVRGLCRASVLQCAHFIMLTARNDSAEIARALDAGADDYVIKPWRRAELLARVRVGERLLIAQQEHWLQGLDLAHKNTELAQLAERLDRAARSDELTGVATRRRLIEALGAAWDLSTRGARPLTCVLFDVDGLQGLNDQHGQRSGDLVLQDVVRRARRHLRMYDEIGRWGGGAFLVVCPETDHVGGGAIAERLRAAIDGSTVIAGGHSLHVTISVGVAQRCEEHATPDELLRSAGNMLLCAKKAGGNRACCATTVARVQTLGSADSAPTAVEV